MATSDFQYNPAGVSQPEGPVYTGGNNRRLTQALFWEYWRMSPKSRPWLPVFCLRHDYDTRKCKLIEVRETFIEEGDPTGYKWAMKYLGDWEVYKKLLGHDWFREAIDEFTGDVIIKNQSQALERLTQIMVEGSEASAISAAKYILEEKWKQPKAKRGRPSKKEVEGELKRQAKLTSEEESDLERIGLKIVGGTDAN